MTKYVKRNIQRAFDYLKICNDDLAEYAIKLRINIEASEDMAKRQKYQTTLEHIENAKIKVVEAIEELALAN